MNESTLRFLDSDLNETMLDIWNGTNSTEPSAMPTMFDALGYTLTGVALLGVVVCWILNCVVVKSLNRMGDERLKMRFLLKNAVIADVLLALSLACRTLFILFDYFDNPAAGVTAQCINVVYGFFAYFVTFYQIFSSMMLAVDRFFSILKPLDYHAMHYSKLAKGIILSSMVGVTLAISLPTALLKIIPGKPLINMCYLANQRSTYSDRYLPYAIVCLVMTTLLIYCSIFIVITLHRRKMRTALGEGADNQKPQQGQASLAITFFLIHLTYLLLYIPGALFFSVIGDDVMSQPILYNNIGTLNVILYLSNTIVDPLIYIFRIPAIRDNARFVACLKKTKPTKSESTVVSGI